MSRISLSTAPGRAAWIAALALVALGQLAPPPATAQAAPEIGPPVLLDPLEALAVSRAELPLRAAAIDLLSRSSGASAARARVILGELARHEPDPRVRSLARAALRALDPPRPASLEALEATLATEVDPAVRRSAVSQLGALGGERAQELLWDVARDATEHPRVAATAIEALFIPEDDLVLQARLEALLAELLDRGASPALLDAVRSRQPRPAVAVPGRPSH